MDDPIQVGENFRFHRDKHNYTLEELRKVAVTVKGKKTGEIKEEWGEAAYFSSLGSLYKTLLEMDATAADSMSGMMERMETMFGKIMEQVNA